WTFVLWGLWHGGLLVLNRTVASRAFERAGRGPGLARAGGVAATFVLVALGWVLFRATSLGQAFGLLGAMLSLRGGARLAILSPVEALLVAGVLALLVAADLARPRAAGVFRAVTEWPWFRVVAPLGDV